jgi:hypothetical protein
MIKKSLIMLLFIMALLCIGCEKKDVSIEDLTEHTEMNKTYKKEEEIKFDIMEYLSSEYQYVGELHDGFRCVKKDGYYGYVNEKGELLIPLIFRRAYDFKNKHAVVFPGAKCGVINTNGEYVVQPKYSESSEIEILDKFILVNSYSSYLYDFNGNAIISDEPDKYEKILVGDNNRITARVQDENYKIYFKIFDYKGNLITSIEGSKNVDIGKFSEGYVLFKDNKSKIVDSSPSWSRQYYGVYTYLDVNGDKATDDYFVKATDFENGIAAVAKGICYGDGSGAKNLDWGIINDKFEPIYNFNYLNDYIPGGQAGSINVDGFYNNFIIIKNKAFFLGSGDEYLMLNMDTDEVYGMYSSLREIPEVDAMIFRFKETGLEGLFVNGILVEEAKYNSINYEGNNVFVLKQGANTTTYVVK